MKKRVLAALTLLLCLPVAAAQAITVTGLETESVARDWASNAFFARMEALTGVHVDAQGVDDADEYQAILSGMLEGNIPADALFKAGLTREQEIALLDAGAIVDLAPLIGENMPNLSALLDAHPDWREVITLEDGRIASLPQLTQEPRQVLVWINSAFLEHARAQMPTTLNELTAALIAMRDRDANGNGEWDEVPADLLGVYEMRWLLPYFGIVADDYNIARNADGTLAFAPELPGYRDFVAYLRGWYEQELLLPQAFTNVHSANATAQGEQEQETVSGLIVTVAPYTNVPAGSVLDYEPLLLAGPDGAVRWRDLLGGVWTGAFAVTSACEDPAQALRWVDALYAQEGALLAYAGVRGEDYEVNEDGYWYFLTDSTRAVEQIRAHSIIYTGETMPGLVPVDFLRAVDSPEDRHVLEASAKALACAEQVTLPYTLAPQAQARADELAAVIGGEVDRGIARFVTGEMELSDENWNAFLASLEEAGSAELLSLFEAAE